MSGEPNTHHIIQQSLRDNKLIKFLGGDSVIENVLRSRTHKGPELGTFLPGGFRKASGENGRSATAIADGRESPQTRTLTADSRFPETCRSLGKRSSAGTWPVARFPLPSRSVANVDLRSANDSGRKDPVAGVQSAPSVS